jgi:membrane-bound lytic murein transglycosylase A
LDAATWADLPDWQKDDLTAAWPAFLIGCEKLVSVAEWAEVCREGQKIDGADAAAVRAFFESRFLPWSARNLDGTREGTVTGYYEPLITGSPERTSTARYPIYAQPEDLISVDLSAVYPDLANRRLRGRLVGNKLLPYYDRAGIDDPASGFKAEVLAWADDAVELFFLQIQGSGRIQFPDGNSMRIGYADQNGHPYRSIGKLLIERGALTLAQASMQGIKAWGQANPDKLQALLEANPSYVFFCKLPDGLIGPLGALGVPLLAERTIAVDLRYIPLGAPVFLATTEPYSTVPLNRLMLAQDTGGAIRGGVRADFFWGFGNDAGARAGKMKQTGRMWVLLPRTYPVPAAPKP